MDIFGAVTLLTTGRGRQSLDRTRAWIQLCLKPWPFAHRSSEIPVGLRQFILPFATEGVIIKERWLKPIDHTDR